MSTTVLLEVTLQHEVDPDREVLVPADILMALHDAGQQVGHGWSRRGEGPWRLRFQLTGPDRVAAGRVLESTLRLLGYDADASVWR